MFYTSALKWTQPGTEWLGNSLSPNFLGAIIFCGGASKRMGKPKAALPHPGGTLLQHIIQQVQRLTDDITMLGEPPEASVTNFSGRVIADVDPHVGPLVSLRNAYQNDQFSRECYLLLSCDLPFLHAEELFLLCTGFESTKDGAVPVVAGNWQPLAACYRTKSLRRALAELPVNEQRMMKLCDVMDLEPLLDEVYPQLWQLQNVNEPEEYIRFLKSVGWEQS
ncbi:MAG: molybdenum cofactor guanylyltransferase [Zavarzinella sp.]